MRLRRLVAPLLSLLLVAAGAAPAAPVDPAPVEHGPPGGSIEQQLLRRLPPSKATELKARLADVEAANLRAATDDAGAPLGTAQAPPDDATEHELVGATKTWLAVDDVERAETLGFYEQRYRLAAVGEHIEIWVAIGGDNSYDARTGIHTLPFPDDDCRNGPDGGARVQLTPAQLDHLVDEFDHTIHPIETRAFSTPPRRNGEDALFNTYRDAVFPSFAPRPEGYFATPGGGDRTVTLVDNIRDEHYYRGDEELMSYTAGFYSGIFSAMFDRNTMTVDAWDWLHRTGAAPPDDPSDDLCRNSPARPFLYEGIYAHEWQHLLQSYVGGETVWLNEGLSDHARVITGYVDPSLPVTEPAFDSHVQCFYGHLSVRTAANPLPSGSSGPENSLTWWGDQGGDEILCDYGAASTFVEYLVGLYGAEAATFLHNDPAAGLDSVAQLGARDGRTASGLVTGWAAMVALDEAVDRTLPAGAAPELTAPSLAASVKWGEDDAYDTPGAPPNGSDYVRLRDRRGDDVPLRDLRRVAFVGAPTYAPDPTQWVTTRHAPGRTDDTVLWSTSADDLDSAVVYEVEVARDDPVLRFTTRYELESGFDFGVVQVSTDGGRSYTSLANERTTAEHRTSPPIAAELPGLTGSSEGWVTTTFDLSSYAGMQILLSFRVLTDGGVLSPGWWIDDVRVGGTTVTDGARIGRSPTEVLPERVGGWSVQLVAVDPDGRLPPRLVGLPLGDDAAGGLGPDRLRRGLGWHREILGAIVTHHERSESIEKYAPYTLTVNGILQPGGGTVQPGGG